MKYILLSLCFFLTCCDDLEMEKQTVKCGMAIAEVGTPQARVNFRIREGIEHISSDIFQIEEQAKDELGMYTSNNERQHQLMVAEYNSWFCRNIHDQQKISEPVSIPTQMAAHRVTKAHP